MYKVIILLCVSCFLYPSEHIAQEHVLDGLEESDSLYLSLGGIDTSHRAGEPLPPAKFNYRDNINIHVFDQGYVPACVGYAIASAVAIRLNMHCNRICKCDKTLTPFSASFIYNQISKGQLRGVSLAHALDTLESQGICPESVFPNDRYSASKQPDLFARQAARPYCFWKGERIFFLPDEVTNDDDRFSATLRLLKANVSHAKPVIVGLRCPEDFITFKGKHYKPFSLPEKANHAALVVGYDDKTKTVEILNSFGPEWGDEGFLQMSYNDFFRMAKYGYIVRLDGGIGDACENAHALNK